jgi:TetR/AcrR family transcriptional regulator, cholesterol catabolism regulator
VGTNGSKNRREAIISAAEQLFRDKGYLATTMRDIADVTGLQGGGSLYAHIRSKEDLLWEIATEAIAAFFNAVQPILGTDWTPETQLRAAIRAHVDVISTRLSAAAVYFDEWRHLSPVRRAEFLAQRDAYERLFETLITTGIQQQCFRVPDARLATLHLLGSINAIRHWYKPHGRLAAPQIADGLATMILSGLKCP